MGQLKMLRPSAPVLRRELPAGFRFAFYSGTDEEVADWLDICRHGLLPDAPPDGGMYRDWFRQTVLEYADLRPYEDVLFVVAPDGRRVATICAVKHGEEQGYIHMVAAHPDVRGLGIGHAMLAFALEQLEARSCTYAILTTDDFRLPAIKSYLDAGFRPLLWADTESDQRARWDQVIASLHYPPVPYLSEV